MNALAALIAAYPRSAAYLAGLTMAIAWLWLLFPDTVW